MTDPFDIVKDELKRSVNKTKSLLESYNVLVRNNESNETKTKLLAETRTNLKSINWDIQDLEETINIASKNPVKYKLTNNEIEERRRFIQQTREFVQETKKAYSIELDDPNLVSSTTTKSKQGRNGGNKVPDISYSKPKESDKYFKLDDNSDDEINTRQNFGGKQSGLQLQEKMFQEQDKNLDLISNRVSNLKNISQTMQNELDDQAFLLDDLGREMETADSRMNTVMKKISKVLNINTDKKQWTMIIGLLIAIFIMFVLLIIL